MKVLGFVRDKFIGVLRFLNIVDATDSLSITNIVVLAMAGKVVVTSNFDWMTTASFLIALINYAHKRKVVTTHAEWTQKAEIGSALVEAETASLTESQLLKAEVERVIAEASAIMSELQSVKDAQADMVKQSEQVQKFLSNSQLASALLPKR